MRCGGVVEMADKGGGVVARAGEVKEEVADEGGGVEVCHYD